MQVKRCVTCQKSKRKFDKPAASLHSIPVSDTWKKIGLDLIQLPLTMKGNRYCITLIDYFSKWAEAEAVPTKEASHIAKFLHKMILRHGCFEEVITDQVLIAPTINCLHEVLTYIARMSSTVIQSCYVLCLCMQGSRRQKISINSPIVNLCIQFWHEWGEHSLNSHPPLTLVADTCKHK